MTDRAKLLLVVVGESREHGGIPLFEYVVRRLRQLDLAGATALRAELGFGPRDFALRGDPAELSADASIVVFAVDAAEKIDRILPEIRALVSGGLVAVLDADRHAGD